MQPHLEQVVQFYSYNRTVNKIVMGTKQETLDRGATNHKKKTETENINTDGKKTYGCCHLTKDQSDLPKNKPTSMSSLIIWNVSKALESDPYMDLKGSIITAQQQLDKETRDLHAVIADRPSEQQHLVCALLAWQQLGHTDADSLYRFIESQRKEVDEKKTEYPGDCCTPVPNNIKEITTKFENNTLDVANTMNAHFIPNQNVDFEGLAAHSSGPVVKLPVETKVIMRLDNLGQRQQCPMAAVTRKGQDKNTMNKIDAACCLDSACVERLASLDATTKELRMRASKLARREAERVELLERAEAAWRDLEIGYQRRLALAEEKEEDINKQIQKLIAERNAFKTACAELALKLRDRGDEAEQQQEKLTEVEKQICDRACIKLRLSQEAAKGEATLAEQQCKAAQYDRDLQFKEEQARRRLLTLENEAESARALTHEAERAMRAELSGLREQIGEVSNQLLSEDEANVQIKDLIAQLRQEKNEMIEDLEGCKVMCDRRMQGRVDELQKRKDQLDELKDKLKECRCKMPIDEIVEVKRTPSLAALCRCAPEDRLLESCSCTSLRGRLLSNLLSDLFGGLQTELGGTGSQMPCQLLKCLEDKHNWDRASVVKTNLRNFFSKLLIGELDIAIATAIENYHAKWVGGSCADAPKMIPEPEDDLNEGWQQRALERRAQKLATQLAEQLFQERAEQLAKRAKDIVTTGPPPCECKPPTSEAAVYPCLMPSNTPFSGGTSGINRQSAETPAYWKRTIQDVTQIRLQIEDLKKQSIKKEDLKLMQEKIAEIVQQASLTENGDLPTAPKDTSNLQGENTKKENKILKNFHTDDFSKHTNQNKFGSSRRKTLENNNLLKKSSINEKPTKLTRKPAHGQSYAVNLCLCGPQKNGKHLQNQQPNTDGKSSWKPKPLRDITSQNSSVKQTKPININLPNPDIDENDSKSSAQPSCTSNCKCFHKAPSNTSIDKLLETLAKWKCDLADPQEKCIKNLKSSFSKYSKNAIKDTVRAKNQNNSKINLSTSVKSKKDQVSANDIANSNSHKDIENNTLSVSFPQAVTTESEYMGAVNLDKSNENVCKCIKQIESAKETNQDKNDVPFKCINSNACECKIYQEMQKDNKRLQTEDLYNQIPKKTQSIQSPEFADLNKISISKRSNHVHNRSELELRSDLNNITQKTEIFPSNCDYYIKFLGVTLEDIDSPKKIKGNAENLLVSKDKHITQRRKKRQKKITHIEPFNSFSKLKDNMMTDENDNSGSSNKATKCECNNRFEELKHFMNEVFTQQLRNNSITHKDEGLDSQSFKYSKNSIESCICCNSFPIDESKDLEVNAFHLLEDHLKGKLEEFKLFSCKSSCIPPEEEEKIFTTILKRVKQVISDCANEMKCCCPGSLPTDGSWNRAYGLLQEYLKIKIKRVQCLCFNDNKDVVLPDILDKVCNLIENDFQRLKDICKCKNNHEVHKKSVRIEDLLIPPIELPERDTNISNTKYEIIQTQNLPIVKTLSKQNSNGSMLIKENTSSQVPPNLGMEAKSCDVMQLDSRNAQTTETDIIFKDCKSNGVMYNSCDCYTANQFSDMFETKEVLVNFYTDTVIIPSDTNEFSKNESACFSEHEVDSIRALPVIEKTETHKSKLAVENQVVNKQTRNNLPHIGYTVDCTCGGKLGACVCMKSIVQANNDKIDTIWKGFLAKNSSCNQDFSYIMGKQNKENDAFVKHHSNLDNIPEPSIQNDEKHMCETEVSVQNEEEIILKNSHDNNLNTIHHTTNTFDRKLSLETSCTNSEGPLDWFDCPIPINSKDRSSTVKLTNPFYYPLHINDYKSLDNEILTESEASKTPQICDCDRVPICHVKMLVENIEKNLVESKCTCDSLISKVCPVHSKRIC